MIEHTPLGKHTEYPQRYAPELLAPVARSSGHHQQGVTAPLPFVGEDVWTAYELSWLDLRGKPVVAVGEFRVPCTSTHLIESKSFKLYLNSFNQERYSDWATVHAIMTRDLSERAGAAVAVELYTLTGWRQRGLAALPGTCIDELDIAVDHYQPELTLLRLLPGGSEVSESLYSHLLRSNCPVTGQPDWASVWIDYQGPAICPESLLRYIVSYRQHQGFHEQCVERFYRDLMAQCRPQRLSVYARYTRRGGLDINPWRSSHQHQAPSWRLERQ